MRNQALADMIAERKRQIDKEGWTEEHDDQHNHSEMAYAAASYALSAADYYLDGSKTRWFSIPKVWPWPDGAWKPKNARRDLVRAGALIIAEIERLDRAAGPSPTNVSADEGCRGGEYFDVLEPHEGPVVPGLDKFEKVYAKDQPQYRPLRTLPGRNGESAISRFHLTEPQRKAIAEGADIYLELLHFHGPLAPSLLMLMSEPADTDNFRRWWKAQTQGPYKIDDVPKAEPTA
jgi:hypothetical protein